MYVCMYVCILQRQKKVNFPWISLLLFGGLALCQRTHPPSLLRSWPGILPTPATSQSGFTPSTGRAPSQICTTLSTFMRQPIVPYALYSPITNRIGEVEPPYPTLVRAALPTRSSPNPIPHRPTTARMPLRPDAHKTCKGSHSCEICICGLNVDHVRRCWTRTGRGVSTATSSAPRCESWSVSRP